VGEIEFLFLLLVGAAVLVRLADAVAVPYPIVLVIAGLGAGLLPGVPEIELEPEVVFLVFLPPLLQAAGWVASPQELKVEIRPVALLVVGLVVATMCAVAVVAHATVEGMTWTAAFILGAVVAPTDPVAALATFGRLGVPQRARLLVEGEAMLNDAVPLVAFRVAVAAALSGTFSFVDASVDFLIAAAGGIVVGLAAGWLSAAAIRRIPDRPLSIFVTVLTAYAAYIGAEELGVSGVLGAVAAGLYGGWHANSTLDADTRLSGLAFWEVLTFALNATLFVLLGTQFPFILEELDADVALTELLGAGLLVALTVAVVRILWLLLPDPGLGDSTADRLAVGWAGMRGAISLAAALSIPLAVPERPEILFLTVVVILVTLVGQGLTLPAVVKVLGVRDERPWTPEEAIARLEAAQSALDRLDELEDEGATEEQLRRLRDLYRARFRQCQAVLTGEGDDGRAAAVEPRVRYSVLRKELIGVERNALVGLRNTGRLRPDVLREIERDLDLEELRLRA
jgi:CPA1 family monovalent cation:H+ antiporter